METIIVSYTPEEATILLRLIDLAVRQAGMEAAEAGVVLTRKIREAAQQKLQQPKANGDAVAADR